MSVRSWFVGRQGLRPGWSFVFFLVAAQAASGLFALAVLKGLHYRPAEGWVARDFLMSESTGLAAALLATALMARIGRRRVREFGLPLVPRAVRLAAAGIALGLGMVGVLAGGIAAAGGLSLHGWALAGPALVRSALVWGLVMILLGLFEESMFRGYALVVLSEGMGFWPAAGVMSLLFGALHYFTKPMETWSDALAVSLLGLLLCFSFRRTGSLWLAVGFHAAFDYAALVVLGAPNTGNQGRPLADRLLAVEFHGPQWLTGGVCGIEASWLILPLIAAAFWLVHRCYPGVHLQARLGETQ